LANFAVDPSSPPKANVGGPGSGHAAAPWVRAAGWSLAAAAAYAFAIGFVFALGHAEQFDQFSALKLLPAVAELALLRELGPATALVAAGLTATIVFHRWGKKAGEPHLHWRDAWLLGAAIPSAFAIVVPFGLLGAGAVCAGLYSQKASEYLDVVREHWSWLDSAWGGSLAAIYGVLLTAVAPLAARKIAAPNRRLAFKLFVTWVALGIAAFVVNSIVKKLLLD
jgi:hypothetical protein